MTDQEIVVRDRVTAAAAFLEDERLSLKVLAIADLTWMVIETATRRAVRADARQTRREIRAVARERDGLPMKAAFAK